MGKKNWKRGQPRSASPPSQKRRNDKIHPSVAQSLEVTGNGATPPPALASTSQSTNAQTNFLANTHQGTIRNISQKSNRKITSKN